MTLWLLLFCLPISAAQTDKPTIIVFAAASLTNALQDVGDGFTKDSSIPVKFSLCGKLRSRAPNRKRARRRTCSSRRIWNGWIIFRPAKLIQAATRHVVLANQLVLVAPVASTISLHIGPDFPLLAALGHSRLAIGDPDGVPAGRYAHESLEKLGVWNAVADHLARADSVRSALALVERGEAPLGIVSQTDALIDKNVRVVDVFPDNTHLPITYPIALVSGAKADAAKFLAYVQSPAADIVFKRYGFVALH